MPPSYRFDRRRMLATLGLGAGAFLLQDLLAPSPASADPANGGKLPLLVFAYFSGGWDTLLTLDPRDHQAFSDPEGKLQTGYDLITDAGVEQVLAGSSSGLVTKGNLTLGPAMGKMGDHFQDLCVVRGMDMGTLTHEVGRRHFLTGKFPRGLAASGSAMPTWVASGDPTASAIPNLVVGGVESYNEGLDPRATGLRVGGYADLAAVLRPLDPALELPADVEAALSAYHGAGRCLHDQLDGRGAVTAFRGAYEKARVLAEGTLWSHFDFKSNPPAGSAHAELYAALGINPTSPNADLSGPKGQAAIAAQALVHGVSQTVSIQPAGGLDTHDDEWQTDHATKLRAGFDALADLVSYLKLKLDPDGEPLWSRTTLVCFSEFSRTPRINARGGRDHHLYTSCLVAGSGIQGNQVIGKTTDDTYAGVPIDFSTGQPNESGLRIRPADVHATVLESMGLSHENVSNQEPKILQAMLKKS